MKSVLSWMLAGGLATGAYVIYKQNRREIVRSFDNMKRDMTRKCRKFKAMME